jgi:large subunit ribosomal protein L15
MQLHDIKRPGTLRYKKTRVGRGGKRGTTSGHGTKGQRSRSGRRIRPGDRDLIQRLPKLRGFKNKPKSEAAVAVNIGNVGKYLKGDVVTLETLAAAGIIRRSEHAVKIVHGKGLTRALTVKGIPVSASAKKEIESRGGKIV